MRSENNALTDSQIHSGYLWSGTQEIGVEWVEVRCVAKNFLRFVLAILPNMPQPPTIAPSCAPNLLLQHLEDVELHYFATP